MLFQRLRTQWRTGGMGGPTGLDYNVLFTLTARMGLSDEERDELEADVMALEIEALAVIAEQLERQRAK